MPIHFDVWTDGGFQSTPKYIGSYGFIIRYKNETFEGSGLVEHHKQTSQVAELMAAIKSLQTIKSMFESKPELLETVTIKLVSDSMYLVKGASDWMHKWKRTNWRDKENVDLWKIIYGFVVNTFKSVEFEWVKGHSGHPMNERADRLCNIALGRK